MLVESDSADATERAGAQLAERLQPGDVVLVSGEVGSGKTTFVRGACRALGVDKPVTSPTFTIGHLYNGPVRIAHLDLYRLAERPDLEVLDDYLTPERIGFVEWPGDPSAFDRVAATVVLEHAGKDRRRLAVTH